MYNNPTLNHIESIHYIHRFFAEFDRNTRPQRHSDDDLISRSGTPTPRNSPHTAHSMGMGMHTDSHSKPNIATAANVSKLPLSVLQHQHQHQQSQSPSSVLLSPLHQIQTVGISSSSTQQMQQLSSLSPLSIIPLCGSAAVVGSGMSRPASVNSSSQHSMTLMQSGVGNIKMIAKYADSLERQSMVSSATDISHTGSPNCSGAGLFDGMSGGGDSSYDNGTEPRLLTITTKKNTNLGISLMGGNAVGIYVHDVQKSSLADAAGLRMGDQILEYNGSDLRRVTAEQAANEISRPAEKVTIVVQHNLKSKLKLKKDSMCITNVYFARV